jgi:predicted PurR-regulated permease PerM
MSSSRPRWSSQTKTVVSILLLAFFIFLVYRFREIIPPLIIAIILAYVLTPLVNRIQKRWRIHRALAILASYLILILVAAILLLILIPPLIDQFDSLNLDLQLLLQQAESIIGQQFVIMGNTFDGSSLVEQVTTSFQRLAEPFLSQTLGFVVEMITSIIWLVFIFVISFYLILENEAVRAWLEGLPPPEYRQDYIRLREEINLIWNSFFRGQIVLATVVATIFTIAGFVLGLPFAFAMGIFAGLMEFLPSIGHAIWLFVASILAFFLGSTWIPIPNWMFMLLVIGLHLIFEQFDLNYLIPRIIGRRVQLQPIVVILGIAAGALIAGVIGILIAAPTIASARIIIRYLYANLLDQDPFPLQEEPPPRKTSTWWRRTRKTK